MILSINQGWVTRKMDFCNDFVQSTLVEIFYIYLPYYFDSITIEDKYNMVMKLNQSLY